MDSSNLVKRCVLFLKEYRYVICILAAGLVLMLLPSSKKDAPEQLGSQNGTLAERDLEKALEDTLSLIKGAGKVEVLLTEAQGERSVYQTDTQEREDQLTEDTVIVTREDRSQTGLILQRLPPKYRGAVVICQGADSAAVRLAVVEAVSKVTGLTTDRITVLKMK